MPPRRATLRKAAVADGETSIAPPSGELAHACFGRTRVSFPALKGDDSALAALRERVAQLPGVVDVEFRAMTGSLIVAHWGMTGDLIEDARSGGAFVIEETSKASSAEGRAEAIAVSVESTIGKLFSKELNVRSLAALVFAAMTIRQIAAGRVAPSASASLWSSVLLLLAERGLGALGSVRKPPAD